MLFSQEIIEDMSLRNKNANVVVKLDMTKSYDRVSWVFLTKVRRRFGFYETIIDMAWRLISNNYYSVLINGESYGFFYSSRELNLGDSLSPALFIIITEVLSRGLNALLEDRNFNGYGLSK